MATVLVGAYGADPSTTQPEKYSSCFWDFVTGWVCQTVDAPAAPPPPIYDPGYDPGPQPLGNTPDPNASPAMLPVMNGGTGGGCCGRCGGGGGSVAAPTGVPTTNGVVTATGKDCGSCKCGYTNREALLAVAVALAFFLLARKA